MMNFIHLSCLCLLLKVCYLAGISALPLEDHHLNNDHLLIQQNETIIFNLTKGLQNYKIKNINNHNAATAAIAAKDAKILQNSSDLTVAPTAFKITELHLPVVVKPRGFHIPKNRAAAATTIAQKTNEPQQPAAQNFFNNYFPDIPNINQEQPYYPYTEDPIFVKFLSQQTKEFQPRHEHESLPSYDTSILGSGDFGILRGGTFYSEEEQNYNNEECSDFYYGDASNTHPVSSTEGFIQKYTYPEEQFAQFRDFADLATPADSAFSQYVVVYAAKNATSGRRYSKPKNIFEQLQEIDKEKALEEKRLRKNDTKPSITKLKLVKTKLFEKKWVQKQPQKTAEEDPLIALS